MKHKDMNFDYKKYLVARSCRTWAKGGPITKDNISYDWQERNSDKV